MRVHPALRPYVSAIAGYRFELDPRAVHHGLPSLSLTVVISADEPLDVGWVEQPSSQRRLSVSVAGLHARPALIRTHGRQSGVQVSVTPLGARVLLGLPAAALAGEIVDGAAVSTPLSTALLDTVAREGSPTTQAQAVEEVLLRALSRGEPRRHTLRPETLEAWRLVQQTSGEVRVAALARQVGWSERTLRTRWADELGLAPKTVCRVARFEHSRALAGSGRSLAETAALSGYADQAHLTRDWRALSGLTPTELLGDPFRIPA